MSLGGVSLNLQIDAKVTSAFAHIHGEETMVIFRYIDIVLNIANGNSAKPNARLPDP